MFGEEILVTGLFESQERDRRVTQILCIGMAGGLNWLRIFNGGFWYQVC
jgi:hypothetical protein